MIGGAFLCYEGFEKLAHRFLHSREEDAARVAELADALVDPQVDMVAVEKDKIKGAIRTDFVLSAEIIAITLGTVATESLAKQFAVLTSIALIMTVGVYGFVAAIVKLDDGGLALSRRGRRVLPGRRPGDPRRRADADEAATIVGTAAMFLVGGGILSHGVPPIHHAIEALAAGAGAVAGIGGVLKVLVTMLLDGLIGIVAGAIVLGGVLAYRRVFGRQEGSGARLAGRQGVAAGNPAVLLLQRLDQVDVFLHRLVARLALEARSRRPTWPARPCRRSRGACPRRRRSMACL